MKPEWKSGNDLKKKGWCKMYIRKAKREDLPQMLEIYRGARAELQESGCAAQWPDGYPQEELLMQDIARGNGYVAEEDGRIEAAFALIYGEDAVYSAIEDGAWLNQLPYATIHRLAGRGEVHGLADGCIGWCKSQTGNLRAGIHADNQKMIHILEKNGFVRCGIIHDVTPRIAYQYAASGMYGQPGVNPAVGAGCTQQAQPNPAAGAWNPQMQPNPQAQPNPAAGAWSPQMQPNPQVQPNPAMGAGWNPQMQPNPYGYPNPGQPVWNGQNPQQQGGNGLGIASMVLGIISLVLFLFLINIPMAIVAIALGIVQLTKKSAKGMAVTGIVTGAAAILLTILFWAFAFSVSSESLTDDYYNYNYYNQYQDSYSDDYYNGYYDGYFGGYYDGYDSGSGGYGDGTGIYR